MLRCDISLFHRFKRIIFSRHFIITASKHVKLEGFQYIFIDTLKESVEDQNSYIGKYKATKCLKKYAKGSKMEKIRNVYEMKLEICFRKKKELFLSGNRNQSYFCLIELKHVFFLNDVILLFEH